MAMRRPSDYALAPYHHPSSLPLPTSVPLPAAVGLGHPQLGLPPVPPPPQHQQQSQSQHLQYPPPSRPPVVPPAQGFRTLPPPAQAHQVSTSHGPPVLPPVYPEAQERQTEHAYAASRSGHATPVSRHAPEHPIQRTPSTPVHSTDALLGHPGERSMEAVHTSFAAPQAPPHPPPHYAQHGSVHLSEHYLPEHHMGRPMMEPEAYPYPQQGQYYGAMPATGPANKRKPSRAAQACDNCRGRKSRCDENRPCASCKDNNVECKYKDTPTAKVEKGSALVTDLLERISSDISTLSQRMLAMEKVVTASSPRPTKSSRRSSRNDTPASSPSHTSHVPIQASGPVAKSSEFVARNPNSFDGHTTAAHQLMLLWPTVQILVGDARPRGEYVFKGEARHPLRLYGKGETDDADEGLSGSSPAASSFSDEVSAATMSDTMSVAHAGPRHEHRRSEPFVQPFRAEPVPDLDPRTVRGLYQSYKRNIYKLHPFLNDKALQRMIDDFIYRHSPRQVLSPFAGGRGTGEGCYFRPNKRKRESEPSIAHVVDSNGNATHQYQTTPARTMHNAIVYLVLALGKICEHGDPLPGPVGEGLVSTMPPPPGLAYSRSFGGSPADFKPSPASSLNSSFNHAPPTADTFRSRHSSVDGTPGSDKNLTQNVDVIPGLVYYREAASILGDFGDSNELSVAQGRLLAGLYKGQIARVQESWSWIHDAARICLYRIRMDGLDKMAHDPSAGPVGTRTHQLLLVYWTCLQLESDILAEMNYPPSGISVYESILPYPNNVSDDVLDQDLAADPKDSEYINFYYSAQLFLRKRLNQMHVKLYGTSLSSQPTSKLAELLEEHYRMLVDWRTLPTPYIQWDDSDPPASEILAARLRAKFYGARYIATRPFLNYALHAMHRLNAGENLENIAVDHNGQAKPNELALFRAIQTYSISDIKMKARICIESAMHSTVALDNVPGRLVVTNIMGTSHAQFGNMLVLSATYACKTKWLSALVPREKLESLLRRTIDFLRRLNQISKTAVKDIEILEGLEEKLFGQGGGEMDISREEAYSSDL